MEERQEQNQRQPASQNQGAQAAAGAPVSPAGEGAVTSVTVTTKKTTVTKTKKVKRKEEETKPSLFRRIFTIVFLIIVIPVILFNVIMIIKGFTVQGADIPSFFGYSPVVVMSDSMATVYEDGVAMSKREKGPFNEGDLIFIAKIPFDDVKVGDVITYCTNVDSKKDGENYQYVTHRVVELKVDDEGVSYLVTRGDANKDNDAFHTYESDFIGIYQNGKIGGAGNAVMWLQGAWGIYYIILIPIALYLLIDDISLRLEKRRRERELLEEIEVLKTEGYHPIIIQPEPAVEESAEEVDEYAELPEYLVTDLKAIEQGMRDEEARAQELNKEEPAEELTEEQPSGPIWVYYPIPQQEEEEQVEEQEQPAEQAEGQMSFDDLPPQQEEQVEEQAEEPAEQAPALPKTKFEAKVAKTNAYLLYKVIRQTLAKCAQFSVYSTAEKEVYQKGGAPVAKFTLRGSNLYLYLALTEEESAPLKEEGIAQARTSVHLPVSIRVSGGVKLTRTLAVVTQMCARLSTEE